MSKELPNNSTSEEVDLGVLFRAIGRLFDKLYSFIKSIFKSILSLLVFLLSAFLQNFKIIAIVMILAGVLGFTLERFSPKLYRSEMFVKPYFDSKYQLVKNIDYFNALISNKDHKALSTIFSIPEEDTKAIVEFEINIGPESENDKIKQYDEFLNSIDSIRAQDISFDDFIENRNIYSSDFYEISVKAEKKDIFRKLEQGLNSSFENTYSEKKMKKRDSLIYIQKESIKASLRSVDSLQKVYIGVLEEEAKSQKNSLSLGEGFTIEPSESKTREFELLNKELKLRDELRLLEEKKVEEDVFFDIVSGFQEVGSISRDLVNRYSIVFPILAFIVMFLIFATKRIINFVKNYEY